MKAPVINPKWPTATTGSADGLTVSSALATLKAMFLSEQPVTLDSIKQIDEFMCALPDESASAELVQALLDVQHLFNIQRATQFAVPASLKGVRWANMLRDPALIARALSYRGGIASGNFDFSTALECALKALEIAQEIGDASRAATCYFNLGVVMRRAGCLNAASACIQASIELREQIGGDYGGYGQAVDAAADIFLRQRNWRGALAASQKAQYVLDVMVPAAKRLGINRVDYACALANEIEALVYLNQFDKARRALQCLAAVAAQYPSNRTDGYFHFATAFYEGLAGDVHQGVELLNEFKTSPETRDEAIECLIEIYERRGEAEKALDATRELLESLGKAKREVAAADLRQIGVGSVDDDDQLTRDFLSRAIGFQIAVDRVGDRLKARLSYLFELAANAELREERGEYVGEHIYRVGRLCAALASEAKCSGEMCWLAEIAGRGHDVGKACLPSHIVLKTSPLTDGERDIIRSHADEGAALLGQLAESRLGRAVAAVRFHHERWDGTGYPNRLKGKEIPLLARIVAICDSFDAMTHARPFRSARSVPSGLREIQCCAGGQFDPHLARLFVELVTRLHQQHGDLDEYLGEEGRRTRWAKSYPVLMRILEERGDLSDQ